MTVTFACCRVAEEKLLQAYADRRKNAAVKREEDQKYRNQESLLQSTLHKELYFRAKSYGWCTFQVNSATRTQAWWSVDEYGQWIIKFQDRQTRLTLNVSQPFVSKEKVDKTNKVEIEMKSSLYRFSGLWSVYLCVCVQCQFYTYPITIFGCSGEHRKSRERARKSGATGQRFPLGVGAKAYRTTASQ